MGVGVFQSIPDLSFTWVCSLSFRSLNAPFEKSLTDREADVRIQTQIRHKKKNPTCSEFETQTQACAQHAIKKPTEVKGEVEREREVGALQQTCTFNADTS